MELPSDSRESAFTNQTMSLPCKDIHIPAVVAHGKHVPGDSSRTEYRSAGAVLPEDFPGVRVQGVQYPVRSTGIDHTACKHRARLYCPAGLSGIWGAVYMRASPTGTIHFSSSV